MDRRANSARKTAVARARSFRMTEALPAGNTTDADIVVSVTLEPEVGLTDSTPTLHRLYTDDSRGRRKRVSRFHDEGHGGTTRSLDTLTASSFRSPGLMLAPCARLDWLTDAVMLIRLIFGGELFA